MLSFRGAPRRVRAVGCEVVAPRGTLGVVA